MHWLTLALLSTAGGFLFNVFIKLSNQRIPEILAAVILQATALMIIVFCWVFTKSSPIEVTPTNKMGIVYAATAGIVIGITNFLIIKMYHMNAPLSAVIPFKLVAGTLLALAIGVLFFQESLTLKKALGVSFSLAGVWMLVR